RCHKQDKTPCNNISCEFWYLFDPVGYTGIQYLDPYYCSDSPEETVKQVNSPAQIKRNATVIPEYFSEKQFGENTAQVLISAAQKRADHKKIPVRLLSVLM